MSKKYTYCNICVKAIADNEMKEFDPFGKEFGFVHSKCFQDKKDEYRKAFYTKKGEKKKTTIIFK